MPIVRHTYSRTSVSKEIYLVVDGRDDSSSDPHTDQETAVEVLMEEEGLDHCHYKQEHCIQIASPVRLRGVLCETDHQSVEVGQRERRRDVYMQ